MPLIHHLAEERTSSTSHIEPQPKTYCVDQGPAQALEVYDYTVPAKFDYRRHVPHRCRVLSSVKNKTARTSTDPVPLPTLERDRQVPLRLVYHYRRRRHVHRRRQVQLLSTAKGLGVIKHLSERTGTTTVAKIESTSTKTPSIEHPGSTNAKYPRDHFDVKYRRALKDSDSSSSPSNREQLLPSTSI
ncbi:hypothetical protein TRIUR3_32655 [Triticum urartu]|uniref:Uncharacterized protein n=1 Tax=Triticum urartu TaxID=4572 RepID=M7YJS7_TRIUA|nr:hypothetical protein TRIUR3_32655 [Triticum urartu]